MIRWEVDVAVSGVQGQLPEHEQALEYNEEVSHARIQEEHYMHKAKCEDLRQERTGMLQAGKASVNRTE